MKKVLVLTITFILLFIISLSAQTLMQEADSLWEQRGANFDTEKMIADPGNVNKVIEIYKKIISTATDSENEEATWRLMRAYYYKGRYTTNDSELKKKNYDLGKDLGKDGLKQFPESAGINLFSAIVWGSWGEEYGIFKAARKGVAGKIKKRCEKVIKVDPSFDEAGGYRVLGRVYFKAPKIPLILGWPSKKKAVGFLEKSLEIAPENLTTKKFLAEALYKVDKKDRAKKIIDEILSEENHSEGIAEDAIIKKDVKALLDEWTK